MPRLSAVSIVLTATERTELNKIVNRHQSPQQLVQRAKILLLSDAQQSNHQIAQSLGVSREMVRLWRNRWLATAESEQSALSRLQDAARPGAPMQFTMEQLMKLYAIACEPPGAYGYPLSHWSAKELAEVMVLEQIVESISVRHVGRLLKEADLKPHQSQYWLNAPQKTLKNLTNK
jgi:putative transposase